MEPDLQQSLVTLRAGGIILYPTDTIWGIGCDATNVEAVARIYQIKQRDDSKALLALVDSAARLERYVAEVPEIAYDLIELSDKPLTIIYSGAKNVASNLLAADGSLGIRVTKEAFSQELCCRLGRPLVSTSANISGEASPKCFAEVSGAIREAVDYIVDYRRDDRTPVQPSSIIRLEAGGLIQIIRE